MTWPGPGIVSVIITERTPHGVRRLVSLTGTKPIDGHRTWKLHGRASHTEIGLAQRTIPEPLGRHLGPLRNRRSGLPIDNNPESQRWRPPHRNDNVVRLASGVDVAWELLAFILDAVASTATSPAPRYIDISDIKAVVSQCSSRIKRVRLLEPGEKRHAERALYKQISVLCT